MKVGVAVECTVCRRTKAPRGRSVAAEMATSMCGPECRGYALEPFAGDLWPRETEVAFGYPVSANATREEVCPTCVEYAGKMHPSHNGSRMCESGSIASGGTIAHCTCDCCF